MLAAALSILGSIWSNPWGRTIIIGIGIFMFGVIKGWGWAHAGREAAIKRAIVNRDNYWQEEITKANDEHERAMQDAIRAAENIRPVRTDDELKRLCADPTGGANCREKNSIRMQSP